MKFRNYIKILFLLLVAAGMAGCVQEYGGVEIPTPPSSNEVTISVTVPGQQIPTTRSIAGANGEATVAFIDLLVFGTDGKFSRHVPGTDLAPVAGDPTYKVTFKAALSVEENVEMVVILANVPASAIETLTVGDTKLEVLSKLTDTWDGAWETNPDVYKPIPMYGEVSIDNISTPVALTRMLARVDVVNNATTDFILTDVYVVNRNTKGYIAQAWNESTGELLSPQYVGDPMVPAGANPLGAGVVSTIGNALHYEYGTGLRGDIYLYEAKANPNEVMEENIDHTKAICLIVKGKWLADNTDYYYRIDFAASKETEQKPEDVQYMPVYRNHLYTFDIEAVNGPGYPATPEGFGDALKSFGVLNNLKTNLHTVDMSGVKYMVFNGQHYIGVEQTDINLRSVAGSGQELVIFTNAKDLKVTVTETDNWIKKNVNSPQHVSGEEYKLTFDVAANEYKEERTGHIYLTAGRLYLKIDVKQNTSFNPGFADVLCFDNEAQKLYIKRMPAQSEMLFFKFGSVVGFTINAINWSESDIKFDPRTNVSTSGYDNIPCWTKQDGGGGVPGFISGKYHSGINVQENGKGDPCKLVGKTAAEIKDMTPAEITNYQSGWRLPTPTEDAYFVGLEDSKYEDLGHSNGNSPTAGNINEFPYYGSAMGVWTNIEGNPSEPARGYFPILGSPATKKNNIGRTFNSTADWLPAAGYIQHHNQTSAHRGSWGYYWSSQPHTSSTNNSGSALSFTNSKVYPHDMPQPHSGCAVRCVEVR